MRNWNGQRVLILGAARQGLALARYLSRKGALVTLNDQRLPEKMQGVMDQLVDYPLQWVLGDHPLSLLDSTDLMCLSGGVPLTLPIVQEAMRRGLPLSNDSQIFLESVSCLVIGITGSSGKTTTTTLVGRMAAAGFEPPVKIWVGGNIGIPLIDRLDEIQPGDLVVLELSSFQLEQMTRSPQVGAVLNITPNHLDRHGTFEAYQAAKAHIVEYQRPEDTIVLSRDDPGAWSLVEKVKGRLVSFGMQRPPRGQDGTYLENGRIYLQHNDDNFVLMPQEVISLRGIHNVLNTLAACAIAYAAGLPSEAMIAGVRSFKGVPHRLEFVRSLRGADWYNDSIATAPERTLAAINAFEEPLILLLGGRDKDLPWQELARVVHRRVDHVVLFGEAAEKIAAAIGPIETEMRLTLQHCTGLKEAVEAAAHIAESGDVVLFSPGATSFDEFQDFEKRGEDFRSWVQELS
ncbi:MAG TPA: UDP-N-acetylmuramoyl-L-alanine--D-glutamate ligase [Levilinea sp.]|nr:UDP-N-acetylmuramoyl-L-alanine--D-glutamate ligase [Levilinea sp.]